MELLREGLEPVALFAKVILGTGRPPLADPELAPISASCSCALPGSVSRRVCSWLSRSCPDGQIVFLNVSIFLVISIHCSSPSHCYSSDGDSGVNVEQTQNKYRVLDGFTVSCNQHMIRVRR